MATEGRAGPGVCVITVFAGLGWQGSMDGARARAETRKAVTSNDHDVSHGG